MFKQVFVYNIFYKLGWFALPPFFTYPLNKSRFMTQQNLKRILEAILKMAFLKVSAPEIVSATTCRRLSPLAASAYSTIIPLAAVALSFRFNKIFYNNALSWHVGNNNTVKCNFNTFHYL